MYLQLVFFLLSDKRNMYTWAFQHVICHFVYVGVTCFIIEVFINFKPVILSVVEEVFSNAQKMNISLGTKLVEENSKFKTR